MPEIVLVNPPPSIFTYSDFRFQNVPLSLVYLAGYVRKLGRSVGIVDAYNKLLSVEEAAAEIVKLDPSIVGITCDTSRLGHVLSLLRMLRQALPDVLLVVGGPFPTFRQKDFLPWADAVVKGEGEGAFAELVESHLARKSLGEVRGIYLKGDDGAYLFTGEREPLASLDEVFHPAWDLVDLRRNFYFWAKKRPIATFVASRGCPGKCIYCTIPPMWGHRYRQVSAQRVLQELALLKREYGVREIYFKDNLFTLNRKWVHELCAGMRDRRLGLSWSCGTGVRYVDEDILREMKQAGCHTVNFGFESGNQGTLDRAGKASTVEQNIQAAVMTRAAGLRVFGFFMLGFPGETEAEMEDTIRMAETISPDTLMFTLVTPFPGTPLWYEAGLDELDGLGMSPEDFNWYKRTGDGADERAALLLAMKRKAIRRIRNWRYWMRHILGTPASTLLLQLLRLRKLAEIRWSPRYRGIRSGVAKLTF